MTLELHLIAALSPVLMLGAASPVSCRLGKRSPVVSLTAPVPT
jgi:hypothetical protein